MRLFKGAPTGWCEVGKHHARFVERDCVNHALLIERDSVKNSGFLALQTALNLVRESVCRDGGTAIALE